MRKPISRRFCDTGPRELLALTRNCYGHPPLAWLVSVPGREIGASAGPSADANRNVQAATAEVEQLINQLAEHEVGQT